MAYTQKYSIQFTTEGGDHEYDIRIYSQLYSGAVKTRSTSAAIEFRQEIDEQVASLQLSLPIRCLTDMEFFDFHSASSSKRKVEVYKDTVLYWTGFLVPNQHTEVFKDPPYWVNLLAVDGLKLLKYKTFYPNGYKTGLQTLVTILAGTGIELPIIIQNTIVSANMTELNPFQGSKFSQEIFLDKTYYEALTILLLRFNSFITQYQGKWKIYRVADLNSDWQLYLSDGTYVGSYTAPTPLVLAAGGHTRDIKPIGELSAALTPMLSKIGYKTDVGYSRSLVPNAFFKKLVGDLPISWVIQYSYLTPIPVFGVRKGTDRNYLSILNQRSTAADYITATLNVLATSSSYVIFSFDFVATYVITGPSWSEIFPAGVVCFKVTLTDGTNTRYLTSSGWSVTDTIFRTGNVAAYAVISSWTELKLVVDSIPFAGTIEVRLYQFESSIPTTTTQFAICYSNIRLYTVNVSAAEPISTSEITITNDSEIASYTDTKEFLLGDLPEAIENPAIMNGAIFNNSGVLAAGWGPHAKQLDEVLISDSIIESLYPCIQLEGEVKGVNLDFCTLVYHNFSTGAYYSLREATFSLHTNKFSGIKLRAWPYLDTVYQSGSEALFIMLTSDRLINLKGSNAAFSNGSVIDFPSTTNSFFSKDNTTFWDVAIKSTGFYNAATPYRWNINEFTKAYQDTYSTATAKKRFFHPWYVVGELNSIFPMVVELTDQTTAKVAWWSAYFNE